MGSRFTSGKAETSPPIFSTAIDVRRNAGGICEGTTPRESGAAITSESNCVSDFSNAASPMGSGFSHANTAAVAAFFAPRRWKFMKITAKSIGAGGDDWKKPWRSSPSATITGASCLPAFRAVEKVRSDHDFS